MDVGNLSSFGGNTQPSLSRRSHSHLLGNSPQKGPQCAGKSDDDLMGMFACGHQLAIPCAEPDLRLPAAGLQSWGELCEAPWHVPTDFRRITGRPGAFDEGTTRRGIASLGNAAMLTPRPTGIFRGRQSQIMHKWSGVLEALQVS